MTTNGNRDPREIEADLDRTRAQLGDTLDALQRKLSPGELFDEALGRFRSGAGSEFVSNFKETVARNPVPMAIAAVGLAWLMISGRSGSTAASEPGAYGSGRISGLTSAAGDKTKAAAHQVRESLRQARTGLERVASSSRERAQQLSHGARERASRVSSMGQHGAARTRTGFEYLLNEQPLVLSAIGVALGAALAAGLPSTRREDEVMGETRDEVVGRAREAGREQLGKAKRVAQSARDAAREEAEREGLTGEAAGERLREGYEKAKRVSTAAADAAMDEADTQGLSSQTDQGPSGSTTGSKG